MAGWRGFAPAMGGPKAVDLVRAGIGAGLGLLLAGLAKLAMVGIGNFLDEVMTAIHAPDAPKSLRGLTLFVTDKTGFIAYGTGKHDWRGIDAKNAPQYRKAVLDKDWTDVAFISAEVA